MSRWHRESVSRYAFKLTGGGCGSDKRQIVETTTSEYSHFLGARDIIGKRLRQQRRTRGRRHEHREGTKQGCCSIPWRRK